MRFSLNSHSLTLFFILYANICVVHADVQVLNVTANAFPAISATCLGVLNQLVSCDASITWAGRGRFEEDDTLKALCTPLCLNALTIWHRRVTSACKDRVYNGAGFMILPQLLSQHVVDEYNLVCLQHNNLFCNAVVRTKAGINPINQKATAKPVATLACEDCSIKLVSAKQQMQLQSKAENAIIYASLTSSCKKTTFTLTPIVMTTYTIPGTTAISSGQPSTLPSVPTNRPCSGTTYTIKPTDTCQSISKSNGISTEWLLQTNSLAPYCKLFPAAGQTLCIDTKHKCKTYTVKAGDSCGSIGDSVIPSLTWTQIVTWNPELDVGCARIKTYVGYEICIERPGGNWVNPLPEPSTSTTTSTKPTRTGTLVHLLPQATWVSTDNSTIWTFANSTRRDCQHYVTGSEMLGNNTCAQVASIFGVSLEDELKVWNPSLAKVSPCTLKSDERYCAQRILRAAENITEYCVLRNFARVGMTLPGFMAGFGIQLQQFFAWNPSVKSDGSGFKTAYEYCVKVRRFKEAGIISTCNKFATANHTSWSEQACQVIETKYGLSHARFVSWNPAVLSTCRGIVANYDYCVSIPNYKPVYSTPLPTTRPTQDTRIYPEPTYTFKQPVASSTTRK